MDGCFNDLTERKESVMYRRIPNFITVSRLALIVPLLVLSHWISSSARIHGLIFVLTLTVVISDWADGFLARRWRCVSDFGKVYDPIADKAVVLLYLPLVKAEMIHFLPVAILLFRDIWSTHLRAQARTVVPAMTSGKIKTAANLFFLCALIAAIPNKGSYFAFLADWRNILYWASSVTITVICVWSGIDYHRKIMPGSGLTG